MNQNCSERRLDSRKRWKDHLDVFQNVVTYVWFLDVDAVLLLCGVGVEISEGSRVTPRSVLPQFSTTFSPEVVTCLGLLSSEVSVKIKLPFSSKHEPLV